MREILKTIKETTKEHFILLSGTGLFAFNLLNFSSGRYCNVSGGIALPIIGRESCINPETFYYYNNLTLILLSIGAIFIVIGLLKVWKK